MGDNRIITNLTEIMKKKEITGPYLLHIHAADDNELYRCVCQLYWDVI